MEAAAQDKKSVAHVLHPEQQGLSKSSQCRTHRQCWAVASTYEVTTEGRPKNGWKRDLEKVMGTASFSYSWKKMKAAAQDRPNPARSYVDGLCINLH